MNARPRVFNLVNPEDKYEVFAIGIDLGDEAVTYREGNRFGVHNSAEGALRLFSKITELRLIWEEDWEEAPLAS